MKAYLAGPMRGYPEFNFPAFRMATEILRTGGHEIVSPHEKDENVSGFDPSKPETLRALCAAETMHWDIQQILDSDAIILLPGWEESQGAQLERLVAESTGKQVFLYDPTTCQLNPADPWDHPLVFRW